MISNGFFTIIALISYFIFRNIGIVLLRYSLKEIQKSDCCPYDSKKFSKRKYFLRNFFIKKSREENLHKLNSLIDDKHIEFNKHLEDENLNSINNKLINFSKYLKKIILALSDKCDYPSAFIKKKKVTKKTNPIINNNNNNINNNNKSIQIPSFNNCRNLKEEEKEKKFSETNFNKEMNIESCQNLLKIGVIFENSLNNALNSNK